VRTDLVRQVGGYRAEFPVAEDYDLWRRLAAVGDLANIVEPLYMYRENPDGLTANDLLRMNDLAMRISREILDDPNYHADIPLRSRLACYSNLPAEARTAITARIIESYFSIATALARRGKVLQSTRRFTKLLLSGRLGFEFVASKFASRLGAALRNRRRSVA
jgi:hypothetical protein